MFLTFVMLTAQPLQAYISQLKLEGLALTSDMVYVTQSGGLRLGWWRGLGLQLRFPGCEMVACARECDLPVRASRCLAWSRWLPAPGLPRIDLR